MNNATYSSVHLRERDKMLEDKHKQQLEVLERKIDRLKWSNTDTLKQLYEQQNRTLRLATSLGFNDIYEAQMTIDNADHDATYTACFERADRLEAEVTSLRDRVQHLEEERDAMQQKLDEDSKVSTELTRLQARYDDLLRNKEQAAERYQADYKTWKTLKEWLFQEEPGEDQKKSVHRKRKSVRDGSPHPPLGNINYSEGDKENAGIVPPPRNLTPKPALAPLQGAIATNAQMHVKMESPLTPVAVNRFTRSSSQRHSASSDTEDDSQAIDPFANMGFKIPALPTPVGKRVVRSADASGAQDASSSTSSRVSKPTPTDSISNTKPPAQTNPPNTSSPQGDDSPRPRKMRRLSEEPEIVQDTPSRPTFMRRKRDQDGFLDTSSRTPMGPKPSQPGSSKNTPGDYSAFKGRGRYGKAAEATEGTPQTINQLYEIDKSRNGGLDFQYDEVVRGKDDRRRMDAGDCECCRDYYEGVGPLPNRLQPPLWRSPPATPVRPCRRHGAGSSAPASARPKEDLPKQISSHKQAISRHRHDWARANTPPGYWGIGFPDTQEVDDINQKAMKMHEQKRDELENAVQRGEGRYKKK
ncbi:DNA repair protein endonuclease SAE2/CtIP C-terminus-domain-containing protein [Infundibulicybe gibba]|nr:DNA repair protein endonuclease SAE2/CtIP C-terminus-domain-containing protein [Infundibulicybe gibba]